MKLLILGGTKFLGRAAVEAALARGHEVTLFNRGETNPELFPEAEKIRGDRTGDLSALRGRSWDSVLDPSAYLPRDARASTETLSDAAGHYAFISSVSVYADLSGPVYEDSPLAELEAGQPDDRLLEDFSNYGPLKTLCERAASEFPGATASGRAGRRRPRARAAAGHRPVHRRPRPWRVARRPRRRQGRRCVQRRASGRLLGDAARDLP
jgi:nucleoside-diphosphate-sugar epimerase